MKRALIILLFLFFTASCNHHSERTITYTVKAGRHYTKITPPTILKSDSIVFEFTPNTSWKWKKPQNNGWSKVTGIAWGNNHENSIRLVYMMINDSTGVLGYYAYVHGISPQTNHKQKGIMDTVEINKKYRSVVGYRKNRFFIELNNKIKEIPAGKQKGIKILAHPYIGGRYTINHDWKVKIKYYFK